MNYQSRLCYTFICLSLLITIKGLSQQNSFSKKDANALITKNSGNSGLAGISSKNSIVTDSYTDRIAGLQMVYLQQTYKSIPVYNVIKTIAFKNGKVASAMGNFVDKPETKVNVPDAVPGIVAGNAVKAASISVNRPVALSKVSSTNVADKGTNKIDFGTLGIARENITAKLLWVPTKSRKLLLCWQVKMAPTNSSDYWLINVDALNETIVSKDNLNKNDVWDKSESILKVPAQQSEKSNKGFHQFNKVAGSTSTTSVSSANYRVIPFPFTNIDEAGGTTLLTNPWESAGVGNGAVTMGWHNDGIVSHDSTKGNNVWAREDTAGDNGLVKIGAAARSSTVSPALNFDFIFNGNSSPKTVTNLQFATTQLFYWNNIMHDISYQYGFDEVSGNFQNSNLGRGGVEKDYVIADVQDGSGRNNANFSSPEDGSNPRMQMFLFNPSSRKTFLTNSPSSLAGYKESLEGSFSTQNRLIDKGPVTGNVAVYNSSDSGDNMGCTALSGTPLSGAIALVDRGGCNFTDKVKNAELAGAIAVIVINRSDTIIGMGGTDNSITIPAVLVGLTTGNAIRAALQNGQTVNVTLSGSVELDGDLDNGIVVHEYAHGISTRLTGGPSNSSCLVNDEEMGEGWSDYFTLMVTTNWAAATTTDGVKPRPIGTYVLGEDPLSGAGIRNYPFSTNKNINPLTYDSLASSTGGETHNVGEIWTTVLWDMTWNIIQMNGINTNLYNAESTGGNSVALKLVTEGMKLQPCLPGFIDGRDAILKADTILYNGKYSCAIWRAFAERGMGLYAQQGGSDDFEDQVADYYPNSGLVKKVALIDQASSGQELTYTITAECKCGPLSGFMITDTLASNVTYVSGGNYNGLNRTVTFSVPPLQDLQKEAFTLKVKVNNNSYVAPNTLLNESFLLPSIPSTFSATASNNNGQWKITNTKARTARYAAKAVDTTTNSRQVLTTAQFYDITGASTLTFWHNFNTEETYDGGSVEILVEGDTTWKDAGKYFVQNGYNSRSVYGSNWWFSGTSEKNFIESIIDLSFFGGKKIKIRFVFTTDDFEGGDGWYVDDILLKNEAGVYNFAELFNSNGIPVSSSDAVTPINSRVLPVINGKFSVEKIGATALLQWTTLQEINAEAFVIEKSADGVSFEAIGTVQATGNSSLPVTYQFTDLNLLDGVNYYRLKQTDKDGQFSYSEVRSITYSVIENQIAITPNPAKNKTNLTIKGNTQSLMVNIINAKGQTTGKFTTTKETTQLNLSGYASGVYYVKITGGNINVTRKLIIQ